MIKILEIYIIKLIIKLLIPFYYKENWSVQTKVLTGLHRQEQLLAYAQAKCVGKKTACVVKFIFLNISHKN